MSEQNITLVRNGYQAFATGDSETLMALFDDDIEWVQVYGDTAMMERQYGRKPAAAVAD